MNRRAKSNGKCGIQSATTLQGMRFIITFVLAQKQKNSPYPACGKTWSDCLDYYCLGLDFCNWFSSRDQCQKLMAHWEQKDEWFNRQNDYQPPSQSELWHGRRFRELSWFWDSSKQYLLPEKCPRCLKIIPTKYLQSNGGNTNLQCMHCVLVPLHISNRLYMETHEIKLL